MTALDRLVRARTDLTEPEIERLVLVVAEWSLIADLAISDLVLWLPTWNDAGFIAVAHVRPATGPTSIPEDLIGTFIPRGRSAVLDRPALLDRTMTTRAPVFRRDSPAPAVPTDAEAVPIAFNGRVIAIMERRASLASRPVGSLEQTYLTSADDLMWMLAAGEFPDATVISETEAPPRVGDGLIRLDRTGTVIFASPNAVSAYHRLGLAVDLEGADLARMTAKLSHRPGPVDEALTVVAGGRAHGGAEVENTSATVALRSLPLRRNGIPQGALVLVRDVTDLRRRERALLTKDATIREVHHRVKNNLQTVAALLRLQARRAVSEEARSALQEAVRRVAAIGIVHDTLAMTVDGDDQVNFDAVADQLCALVMEYAHPDGGVQIIREGTFGEIPGRSGTALSVVLTELLHNAVEHGVGSRAQGQVVVRVTRERGDEGGQDLVVCVADDGPRGQVDGDVVEGLGLQIVRTLVQDELSGSLNLERDSQGFRATVRLPVEVARTAHE
jgi:two-component system, sensor histidine kinase PdtaS